MLHRDFCVNPDPECIEFQTRSEVTGIIQHKTFEDAITHCNNDLTVWKLSYESEEFGRVKYVKETTKFGDMWTR